MVEVHESVLPYLDTWYNFYIRSLYMSIDMFLEWLLIFTNMLKAKEATSEKKNIPTFAIYIKWKEKQQRYQGNK